MKKYTKEQAEIVLNDFKKCVSKDCQDAASTFLKTMFGLPETGLVVLKNKKDFIIMRTGEETGYGFNMDGLFRETKWSFYNNPDRWRPATKEDEDRWKKLLIEEAKRRGYKDGDKFEYGAIEARYPFKKWSLENNGKWLYHYNYMIFDNGEWDEVIEELKDLYEIARSVEGEELDRLIDILHEKKVTTKLENKGFKIVKS